MFGHSWIPVCIADEVREPGDFLVVEVAGRSLIVCRNAEGELRAHHNVCRHRGSRLCDPGPGHADRFFKCPYHSWAYDLDGHSACSKTLSDFGERLAGKLFEAAKDRKGRDWPSR